MKRLLIAATVLLAAGSLWAQTPPAADTSKLSEDLIYSVNRTPEHTFDTARAVEVITIDDLWRKNGMTLADVLVDEAGFIKYRVNQYTSSGLLRGLIGKQVLILIDGVKVNNALTGDTPNIDLIDLSQVERIEIVRGVVSVLGTESLGGVINVITRKTPQGGVGFGGTATMRYSGASNAFSTPVQAYGQTEKLRYVASVNYLRAGELRGGEGTTVQRFTDFNQKAGNLNLQYLMSQEKTVNFSYHGSQIDDAKSAALRANNTSLLNEQTPNRLQLASLSYQDLTSRPWADSLKVTAFWNQQETGSRDVRTATPTRETDSRDRDRMLGLNLEAGTFVGQHHQFTYGVDYAKDFIDSWARDVNLTTDVATYRRGRYTDGSEYSSMGIYFQDHFSVTKWLTATAGIRYGTFKTSGSETLPVLGTVSLDSTKSDFTGALNLILHVTPTLNVIGNVMDGYRAPNLQDISRFSLSSTTIEVPATRAEAEDTTSYELGVKYENRLLSGSAFYYLSDMSNLLLVAASTYNGLGFIDTNKNGARDTGEPAVRENLNIGQARLQGWEADVRVRPTDWMQVWANMTRASASSNDAPNLQAGLVQRVPPPFGAAGFRLTADKTAFRPWAEVVYSFTKSYKSGATTLSPSFAEYRVHAGATVNDRLRLLAGVDNITNQRYTSRFSTVPWLGRRFVLATEYKF